MLLSASDSGKPYRARFYLSPKVKKKWFQSERDFWKAAYLLNLLYWKKCQWLADETGFVRLKRDYLEKVIGRHGEVDRVLKVLLYREVIKIDNSWKAGKSAKGYKLTKPFKDTKLMLCEDPQLNQILESSYTEDEQDWLPVHHKLKEIYQRFPLEVNEKGVRLLRSIHHKNTEAKELRTWLVQKCFSFSSMTRGWFKVCSYGRVHTPLTSLERQLLPYLKVEDEDANEHELLEIDVKNCQPLLLILLMLRGQNSQDSTTTNPNPPTQPPITIPTAVNNHPYSLKETLAVCQQGLFYDTLFSALIKTKQQGIDRLAMKKRVLTIIYDKNRENYKDRIQILMESIYPDFMACLKKMKTHEYQIPSRLAQKMESRIIIEKVCSRVFAELGGIPLFTRHDSLLVLSQHVDKVKDILLDEFAKEGALPAISIRK